MSSKSSDRPIRIHLEFNAPIQEVNIHVTGSGEIGIQPNKPDVPDFLEPDDPIVPLAFTVLVPTTGSPNQTRNDGVICAIGEDTRSLQLRAYIFGGRTAPPTEAEITAAFPAAIKQDHNPNIGDWLFPEIGGCSFTAGTKNYLVIYRVLDTYTMDYITEVVPFTSFSAYTTFCDNSGASLSLAAAALSQPGGMSHSDHPQLFELVEVCCGSHGPSSGKNTILVREPGSHENTPAWRSCNDCGSGSEWVLSQFSGTDGKWHATLTEVSATGSRTWTSAPSWSSKLGGVLTGAGLPEVAIRRAG